MKCFYHHNRDAIGLCKSCARGLCPSCAADLSTALACIGRCEADVRVLLDINKNALQYSRNFKRSRFVFPVFLIMAGVLFAALGWLFGEMNLFIIVLGCLFLVFGVAVLVLNRRLANELKA